MSEVEHQATDILLPGARVSIFSKDSETLNSAAIVKDDWRFARVELVAAEGDVDTAIETYKTQKSPELLIIQTDEIDDQFTARLGELSQYCEEGTAAIIVGPVNDVYLYRKLIDMGVSDYLVRPIIPDVLSEVVAKALIERLGVSDSRLVAFIGAKGGVGTSTFAQIAAWMLSEKLGQKTVLMDAAGATSALSVGMEFDPSTNLHEVARAVESKNEDALKRMFYQASEKLSILATGADAMLDPPITAHQYEAILDNIMVKSPVVLVDLSGANATIKKIVLSRAHKIVAFTTPTLTSLRFSRSLLKEITDIRGGDKSDTILIVNQSGVSKANEVTAGDISEAIDHAPQAVLEHLPNIFMKHESEIKSIFTDKDASSVLATFLQVISKAINAKYDGNSEKTGSNSGLLGGLLNKITAK